MPVPIPRDYWKAPFAWAGGKYKQIAEISKYFPTELPEGTYIEPFVGAGTVLINRLVAWQGRNVRFIAGDLNDGLINFWLCLQQSPNIVIDLLSQGPQYQFHNAVSRRESSFYAIRSHYNTTFRQREAAEPLALLPKQSHRRLDFGHAADFLYLIKTCHGQVWQTSHETGECTMGPGPPLKYLLFPDLLLRLSALLKSENVLFMLSSCFDTLEMTESGNIVYSDGPYDKTKNSYLGGALTQTSTFQQDLAIALDKCRQKGAGVYVSNTNTSLIQHLFQPPDWYSIRIHVNGRMSNTTSIQNQEILILNQGYNQRNPKNPVIQLLSAKRRSERNVLVKVRSRYNPYILSSSPSSALAA